MYPATDEVLAVQESVTEGCEDCTPVPERPIVSVAFEALLVIVMSPDEADAVVGAKTTVSVADCPAAMVSPADRPVMAYPEPDMVTDDTDTVELPAFFTETVLLAELPVSTSPKERLEGLAVRVPETAVPLSGSLREPSIDVKNVAVPETVPADSGAKRTLNEMLLPAAMVTGVVMPVSENPVPAMAVL